MFKAVLGFGAGHVIRCQLLAVRNACEVTRTESPECKSTHQRTEDGNMHVILDPDGGLRIYSDQAGHTR